MSSERESGLVLMNINYHRDINIEEVINILMSNFFEIDFVMKIHAKKSRRFDLSEAIFKCE